MLTVLRSFNCPLKLHKTLLSFLLSKKSFLQTLTPTPNQNQCEQLLVDGARYINIYACNVCTVLRCSLVNCMPKTNFPSATIRFISSLHRTSSRLTTSDVAVEVESFIDRHGAETEGSQHWFQPIMIGWRRTKWVKLCLNRAKASDFSNKRHVAVAVQCP